MAGVTVELTFADGRTDQTVTGKQGNYKFELDEPGTYAVQAQGGSSRTLQVTKGGEITNVDLTLR